MQCLITSCKAQVTSVVLVGGSWLHLLKFVLQHFWPAVAEGSWLLTVHGASHNTFLRASWLVDKLLDVLCKRGSRSHQVQCPALLYNVKIAHLLVHHCILFV